MQFSSRLLGSSSLRSAAFAALAMAAASPAFAQEVPAEQDPPETLQSEPEIESGANASTDVDGQALVVTGSRIRRPNLESTVPITSVGGEEFYETGQTSIGDVLNELPALRSTFSQSNSSRFLGTAGLNLLDLRGLGTQRTLVLQNGRRHVGSDILNFAVSPDVNTFPTDLIERVDIVTGGNSAIYGSDAIAGVVNFVLKRDFEGIQLRGQGGISQYGDAGNYYASALAGTNFADGRGNVAINLEYARQNDWYTSGRRSFRRANGFIVVDTDSGASSDNQPDRVFLEDLRNAIYSEGGSFYGCCEQLDPDDPLIDDGVFVTPFLFQPDGTLVPQTGQRVGAAYFGSFLGGNGSSFRDGKQFGLAPKLDRFSANLLGHFTVSRAFEPFIEAKYVRTESLGNASGPFFTTATGSPREVFFTDNPFLNPQARSVIQQQFGLAPDEDTSFYMYRSVNELGQREEDNTRETYRIVGGVRGDFNDDWSYEASLNYGKTKESNTILGNINLQRYLLAIDAVRNPATGQIVCRAQIDPSAALPYDFPIDEDFANAQLANDVASCVPVNLFGVGNVSAAARDYLVTDSVIKAGIEQFVANAFMSGDSSEWFELPGGPIGFALGAEYRKEDVSYRQDELTRSGVTFYNGIADFTPEAFEVKEVFGEIRLPILRDTPGFEELTASAAGRLADYKGSTGTVFAWNAGLEWSPIRDVRFRGNYSRAVRAPNLVDLAFPLSQNFANPTGLTDPCSVESISEGSENRQANCLAAGVPVGFQQVYTSSLAYQSGGNPDLREETSDSFTIGGVVQPRFLPGFALTVDYYDITVDDVITSPTVQEILNTCYDLETLDNQFCGQFERNLGPGEGPRGEQVGQILENSLIVAPLNYAKLKVRGIDFEASYRRQIADLGRLNTRFIYTHVLKNDQFLDPVDPNRADQIKYELGDPQDAFNWNIDFQSGPITVGYQMRYLGKQLLNGAEYEFFFSKQGRDPENPDWADRRFYPSIFYHDVRMSIDAGQNFNFYVGIDDITNRQPPLGQTGAGGGSGIFRNIGRFFYAGAVAKF